jgi:hypothetical protein
MGFDTGDMQEERSADEYIIGIGPTSVYSSINTGPIYRQELVFF